MILILFSRYVDLKHSFARRPVKRTAWKHGLRWFDVRRNWRPLLISRFSFNTFNFSFQDTSVLSPAVPLGIVLYLTYYNFAYSNTNVFERAPCLFNFAFGLMLAKVSILLLVSYGLFFGCLCLSVTPFSLYSWSSLSCVKYLRARIHV